MIDGLSSQGIAVWFAICTFLLLTAHLLLSRDLRKLPPSPGIALPVIGHLYLMKKNPRELFMKWRRQLGEIFMLQMGAQTVVVLSSYEILKDTLIKQADLFSDRPNKSLVTTAIPDGKLGILFSSGALWKEQRSTTLAILRDFGMGKNVLAEKIAEEVSFYIAEIAKSKGEDRPLQFLTTISVSNNICSIIFGRRFEFDDERFKRMLDLFDKSVKLVSGVAIVNFLPFLRHLPIDVSGASKYVAYTGEIREFCKEMIQQQKGKKDTQTSFVAAYLEEMKKRHEKGQSTFLDETNLVRVMQNLFAAGTETTSTTISWFLLFCLHYPHVQEKIYEEIVEQIGTERVPNILDKPKLKYLNAAIKETLRRASIVPFSVQHQVNQNVQVKGYIIPKGSQIVPHLDAVLLDEGLWGDPLAFRPERFLDMKGNVIKREEFLPFSLGRRICLGEALAKMELFLYLSALCQRFKFLPADASFLPPLKDQFGITCPPQHYLIRCVERIK